ncbi:MAG: HAD-IIB family hydrolase [Limisphaerales bacterium]
MTKNPSMVVFTDLDGTLLDHETYDYSAALSGLALLKRAGVPLVFCSSKTRVEQVMYHDALGIRDPFIVENGGAVYMEADAFDPPVGEVVEGGRYRAMVFGQTYREIRSRLIHVRYDSMPEIRGYGDLDVETLMPLLGLDAAATRRATRREFEETVVTPLQGERLAVFREALAEVGLTLNRGGRFLGVSAGNDKGRAVRALTEVYRARDAGLVTVGIGDSWNDVPMLRAVDRPYLVQRPGGRWEDIEVAGLEKIPAIGPSGWTLAMQGLLGARS